LVGRDVLIGVLAGVALVAGGVLFFDPGTPSDLVTSALESLTSARHFIGVSTIAIFAAPPYAVASLFFVMLIRAIVRSTWVAAAIGAVVLIPFATGGVFEAYALVVGLGVVTIMLRIGLLALSAALLVQFVMTRLPVTLDFNAWYFGSSMLILLLIAGLGAYGCLVTTGSPRGGRQTLEPHLRSIG
jgi:hypothetical protein